MTRLSAENLPEGTRCFSYDRNAVTTGIVHFGIGNFHRAHQAVYVEELLERGDTQWGITGISLRSSAMKDALEPQDYLYTLAVLDEEREYRVIGSIKDVVVAPNDPKSVIELIAAPNTQIVSSTITEKGYYLSSGKVDIDAPAFKAELKSLKSPKTIYGFLAQGLIQRFQNTPTAKLTIMCCDNISSGGELIAQGVQRLLSEHNAEALEWSKNHVSFISSMVDRVSPATDDTLRKAVLRDTGRHDASPVSAEPFSQWIIEDGFAGERPAFDQVGAAFTKDISSFERMKLSYLNAAHTIASTLGYLSGDVYVHEAIERPDVLQFMRQALYKNVMPNAPVPDGCDAIIYIEDVIKRFQNCHLPYANLQVGTDSSQKIQQRWFPTIDTALSQNRDVSYFAFSLAAWVIFIQTALKNDVLNDPKKASLMKIDTRNLNTLVDSYLKIANADKFKFHKHSEFNDTVITYGQTIKNHGIQTALSSFLKEKRLLSLIEQTEL